MKQRHIGSTLRAVLYILLAAILMAGAVLFGFIALAGNSADGTISVLGYRIYLNDDSSMSPAVKNHSFILAKPQQPEDVKPRSVVTYTIRDENGRFQTETKRVLSISPEDGQLVFTLKGDNEDSFYIIRENQLCAISVSVFSSSLLGRSLLFFYRWQTICTIVVYGCLALLLAGVFLLFWRSRQKQYVDLGTITSSQPPPLSLDSLITVEEDVTFEKSPGEKDAYQSPASSSSNERSSDPASPPEGEERQTSALKTS